MTIGKTQATTEFRYSTPVTVYLWIRPEVSVEGTATLIDMTDNVLPIEDSGFGYRLQLNANQKVQLVLKTEAGKVYKHVCDMPGALPLNRWSFVALRFGGDNIVSLTCLSGNTKNIGRASLTKASESFQVEGKIGFKRSVLPRVASNANGDGSFFHGSVDEIGLVRGWVTDAELLEAYKKMIN